MRFSLSITDECTDLRLPYILKQLNFANCEVLRIENLCNGSKPTNESMQQMLQFVTDDSGLNPLQVCQKMIGHKLIWSVYDCIHTHSRAQTYSHIDTRINIFLFLPLQLISTYHLSLDRYTYIDRSHLIVCEPLFFLLHHNVRHVVYAAEGSALRV